MNTVWHLYTLRGVDSFYEDVLYWKLSARVRSIRTLVIDKAQQFSIRS